MLQTRPAFRILLLLGKVRGAMQPGGNYCHDDNVHIDRWLWGKLINHFDYNDGWLKSSSLFISEGEDLTHCESTKKHQQRHFSQLLESFKAFPTLQEDFLHCEQKAPLQAWRESFEVTTSTQTLIQFFEGYSYLGNQQCHIIIDMQIVLRWPCNQVDITQQPGAK